MNPQGGPTSPGAENSSATLDSQVRSLQIKAAKGAGHLKGHAPTASKRGMGIFSGSLIDWTPCQDKFLT